LEYTTLKPFELKEFRAAKGKWSLAEQQVTFNEVDVAGNSYSQGVLPIYSDSKCAAAVVSLYSKAIAKANTVKIIQLLSLVYLVCIILIVPPVTLVLVRGIINPIQKTASMMREIAGRKGDLTKILDIKGEDEIAQLGLAFNELIKSMSEIVAMIRTASDKITVSSEGLSSAAQQINASSTEIGSTIQQVSKGVTEQANKSETTYRVMDEMATSVKQVSTNAQAAATASEKANTIAQKGGDLAHLAVEKMTRINEVIGLSAKGVTQLTERSKQITEIVDILTSIADQTNLLALNAAIESARAGEAGRGFAVVAEEVRKLAEKSAKSAKDIRKLISEIEHETVEAADSMKAGTKEVAEGAKIVNEVGNALIEIVQAAQNASQMVSQIASATVQQLEGTKKVATSVDEVAAISRQSSSAAQEATASTQEQIASMQELSVNSQELSRLATDLKELVSKFKLEA